MSVTRKNREYYPVREPDSVVGKAAVFIKFALIPILLVLLILSLNLLMEYSDMLRQKENLQIKIEECGEQIEELEYLINAPMDRDYIIRIAKGKLGLVLPEEIIFYTDDSQ